MTAIFEMKTAAQIKEAAALFDEAQSKLNYDDYDNAVILLQRAVMLDANVTFCDLLQSTCMCLPPKLREKAESTTTRVEMTFMKLCMTAFDGFNFAESRVCQRLRQLAGRTR